MSASLIQIVENLGTPRVMVVGDIILDRYVWGDAERISQEAPVILMRATRREERLGGAASVASMLTALGAKVTLAGVVGDDLSADRCRELFDEHSIEHELVLPDSSRPSTLKERYIGRAQQKHPQQMMRVDYEVRDPLGDNLANQLATAVEARLTDYDIVLISDYDKGVCTPPLLHRLIAATRKRGIKSLVDPIRGGNYGSRYKHCSGMTPNRLEAGLAAGMTLTDLEISFQAAEKLQSELGMEVGMVTLDSDGMVLVDQKGERRHFPIRPRQVYDITGAGDMVLSVLGVVLAAGHDYPDAISLAQVAAGLEVERIGVATVSREEIIRDLLHGHGGLSDKVVSRETLAGELANHRRTGQSIVFTNGCFDILHAGHIQYLREAKAQGDLLVVGLNTDASVRRLGKGNDRPINGETDRATVLSALESVDYVCLFDEDTPLSLIEMVRPNVLVKGADYKPEQVVGKEVVESYGGRLHLAQLVAGKSTTSTLAKIQGG
ncbi:MAG: D-glycero-beta-D-manno-heptose 1-phosphate adenylyltransferase [Planctomycetota bacterium]